MEIVFGLVTGVLGFLAVYCLLGGLYTINQNERAVVTNFGRAERIGNKTSLDLPIGQQLRPEEKERYVYPLEITIIPEQTNETLVSLLASGVDPKLTDSGGMKEPVLPTNR